MTTIYISKDTALPKRKEHDLYQTEPSLIRAAIKQFVLDTEFGHRSLVTSILDIGADDGRWGRITADLIPQNVRPNVAGVELRPVQKPDDFNYWWTGDYTDPALAHDISSYFPYGFDLIVSNPPYHLAEEIVWQAWKHLAEGGRMIMLLRLSFQAGVNRYNNLWNVLPLRYLGVLSRRPSFYGGKTNGTDYGLYVWDKGIVMNKPWGVPRRWETVLVNYDRDKDANGN